MKNSIKLIAICYLLAGVGASFAQQSLPPVLQNVVQLSATGSVEVPQDMLSIAMSTTRDGSDASVVQSQLKSALDAALVEAKKVALPGQLELRTGNFSLYPRYGRDGKPIGWQGTAELILEGRDFARISGAAGKIQTLTVSHVSFNLSREQRTQVEGAAQSMAIERFKARAGDIARSFGFTGYSLREVNVSANDQGYSPRPRMMAMEAKAVSDAPVPVEAGKTAVLVTVSGSVQLK
ncbi:MAG: SIMPL domain-containing protein [Rhodoferax sp.]